MDEDLSLAVFHDGLFLLDKPIKDARKLAGMFKGAANIYKLDINENKELCRQLRISTLTYLIYQKGAQIERIEGEVDRVTLQEKLVNLLHPQ